VTMLTTATASLMDMPAWLGPLLLDSSIKGAVLLLAVGAAVAAMRKSTAAARHLALLLALGGLLAMPLLSAALPELAILPQWIAPTGGEQSESIPPKSQAETAPPLAQAETADRAGVAAYVTPDGQSPTPTVETASTVALPAAAEELPPASPQRRPNQTPSKSTLQIALSPATVVWAVGVLLSLAPALLGRISLWRLRRSTRDATEGWWGDMAREAAAHVGMKRPVTILISERRSMPMIWGILRPKLLLPAEAEKWTKQRCRSVLLHELAHAARWDCATKLAGHLACAAHWFNPLAWLALRRLQREAEAACDDLVLATGSQPAAYAQHILDIASSLQASSLSANSSIAMARASNLEGRLLAILDGGRNRRRLTILGILVAAVIAAAVIVPMAMMRASSVVADDQGGVRLLGVIPDGGKELLDDQGKPVGSLRIWADPIRTWSKSEMRRDFVFEMPGGDEPFCLTGPVIVREAGEDRRIWMDMNQSTVVRRQDDKQLLVLPRRLPRTRPGWLWGENRITRVDMTLRWYQGPRGKPDAVFTGPFEAGTTVGDDGGKGYQLTVEPPDPNAGEHRLKCGVSSTNNVEFWMALSVYDSAGNWRLAQYDGGTRNSGGKSDLKFVLRGMQLKDLARIEFNEEPHVKEFRDILVRYDDRPERNYSPYFDEAAARLGIDPVDPIKVLNHNFASPGEAIACVDVVRSHLISRASHAILYGEPKLRPEDLDEQQATLLRKTAGEWASATDEGIQIAGLQMGLWGKWPEFVEPALEAAGSDLRLRDRAAGALRDYREHLTADQLAQIRQLLIDRDDKKTCHVLLDAVLRNPSPAATAEAVRLARSDKVWLWWPAMRVPAVRKKLADTPDLSDQMRLRLALNNPAAKGYPLTSQAKRMLPKLPSRKLLQMSLSTFSEVLKRTADHLDRETCTKVFVRFLDGLHADWPDYKWQQNYSKAHGNDWWAVDRMSRYLNLWHGLDIAGLGTDVTQQTADEHKVDWKTVAAEAIAKTRALNPVPVSTQQEKALDPEQIAAKARAAWERATEQASRLRNLHIMATRRWYEPGPEPGKWRETPVQANTWSWYERLEGGRTRVDLDPTKFEWIDGTAPYAENRYLLTFDGSEFRKIDFIYSDKTGLYRPRVTEQYPNNKPEYLLSERKYTGSCFTLTAKGHPGPTDYPARAMKEVLDAMTSPRIVSAQVRHPSHAGKDMAELIWKTNRPERGRLSNTRLRAVLDPQRGFSVTQLDFHVNTELQRSYRAGAWKRLGPELWFPTRWEVSHYGARTEKTTYRADKVAFYDSSDADAIFQARDVMLNQPTDAPPHAPNVKYSDTPQWTHAVTATNPTATALHEAAGGGHGETCQKLIAAGYDVNARNSLGQTPLHLAASGGHQDTCSRLLKLGAGINATDVEGKTPLHLSATGGHQDTCERLLRLGADINAEDINGKTPLQHAAAGRHSQLLDFLLGASLTARRPGSQGLDRDVHVPHTGREIDDAIQKALSVKPVDVEALRSALPEIDKITVTYAEGPKTKQVLLARQGGKWATEETIRKLTEPLAKGMQVRVRASLRLPDGLAKQRDALLAEADVKIRRDLLRLSARFPQLRRTNWGFLMDRLARKSPAGQIRIGAGWYPREAGKSDGTAEPVREEDRYRFTTILLPRGNPIEQLVHHDLYPHLDLRGQVRASATDKRLEGELRKIIKDALAPLGELETSAAGSRKNVATPVARPVSSPRR